MEDDPRGTVPSSDASPDDGIDKEMKEELMALGRITHAMESFAGLATMEMERWARNLGALPERHKDLLESGTIYSSDNRLMIEAVHHNDMFLRSMLEWLSEEQGPFPLHKCLEARDMWRVEHDSRVSAADFEKVVYVLKNIARDWSGEYSEEREVSYGCICRALEEAFSDSPESTPRVLIPGCGLGRLCVDIASRGFDASGNEHSYYMLLTTAYFLNGLVTKDQWTVYPWVLQTTNMRSLEDQLRPISFPDVVPYDVMSTSRGSLSMLAGDFVEVCSSEDFKEYYNAVVTCFFLDTAHNVIEYMELLWDVLEPGGIWIHFGPLQWHWADAHTYLAEEEVSIELPLNKVVEIAKNIGFVFDDGITDGIQCPYMSTINGMRPQVPESPTRHDNFALSATRVSGQTCNEDLYAIAETLPDGSILAFGTNVTYQGASIQGYVGLSAEEESCSQGPESVGIRITAPDGLEDWLTVKLPVDPDMLDMGITPGCEGNPLGPGCVPPNDLVIIPFPANGSNTTYNAYNYLSLNWNPMGHPPLEVYNSPHFDFHFFQIPQSDVDMILPAGPNASVVCTEGLSVESFAKANVPIPEMCFPEGYANLNAVAPFMGNHYVPLDEPVVAAALAGKPDIKLWQDPSWIVGGYEGKITFLEPMVKRQYLQEMVASYLKGNGTEILYAKNVSVPRGYPDPGYHATSFSIRVDSPETMWISLENFQVQESSGCDPTGPKVPTSYLDWAPPPPDAPPLPEACKFTKSPGSGGQTSTSQEEATVSSAEEENVSMQSGQKKSTTMTWLGTILIIISTFSMLP